MRIERIGISAYGRFDAFDSGAEPLGRLNVVSGPNESGKSTFFSFLTTLLYGFQPASLERHPYAPWNGTPIEGQAELRLDDGSSLTLTRRLVGSPWGRVRVGATETDIRNRALPFLDHIPRSVFTQVYALTLAELGKLEGATWSTIQERMIASLVSDDVRSAQDVIDELKSEAGALWRPNRRGHQSTRGIADEIRALQHRRREAVERDQEVRTLDRRLGEARQRLQELRALRAQLVTRAERLERLVPDAHRLARLDALADTPDRTGGLPLDPARELRRLRSELEEASSHAADLRARSDELDREAREAEERLEAHAEEAADVALLRARALEAGLAERRLLDLESELRALDAERDALQAERRSPDAEYGTLDSEPSALQADRSAPAAQESAPPEEALSDTEPGEGSPARSRPFWMAALAIGAVGLLSGIVWARTGLSVAAAVGLGCGLSALVSGVVAYRRERLAQQAELAQVRARAEARSVAAVERAREEEAQRQRAAEERRRSRAQQSLAAREQAVAGRMEREEARIDETRAALELFFGELGQLPPASFAEASDALDRSQRERGRLELAARAAREAVARLAPELERQRTRQARLRAELETLQSGLAELGGGDVALGIEAVERFRTQDAETLRLTREIQERHGSLEQLRTLLADFTDEHGPVDDGRLAAARARTQEASEEIEDVRAEITGLEKDIAHLGASASVTEIDSEIESLREERHRQERERDRATVLARVVETADRRFRERHQPDVVRRGAEYVAHITGGRYRALSTGEGPEDALLYVMQEDGHGIDVSGPLSTGTKEQIYLALRLAVVDHLDQDRERLPLFLDESFVNWDAERRNQGLRLLRSLSQHRQIFVFTCHQEITARLQTLGAHVLRLGDGEQVELW